MPTNDKIHTASTASEKGRPGYPLAGRGFAGGGGDPLTGTGASPGQDKEPLARAACERGRLHGLCTWRGRREPR